MTGHLGFQAQAPAPDNVINSHRLENTHVVKNKAEFTIAGPGDTDNVIEPDLDLGDDLFSEVARRINLKMRISMKSIGNTGE